MLKVEPALGYFGIGYLLRLRGLGGAVTYSAVASNGGFFPSLGNSSHRLAGGVFDTTRFVQQSWRPFSMD